LQALRIENAAKTKALQAANERIAALMSEIAALTAALDKRIRLYDTQQHEIAALSKKSDVLRQQLEAIETARTIEVQPAPAFVPAAPKRPFADRRIPNDEGDVIRRALEAIEADTGGNGHATWMLPPSHGAVPFGH
jgi:chromosome segregation ATPase